MKIFGNAIWQLIYQSDKVTWFVLIALLMLSIFCWTIFFYKLIIWRSKKKQIHDALIQIRSAKSFEEILQIASSNSNNVIGYFLSKNLAFLKTLLESKKSGKFEINDREWNFIQHIADNTLDDILYKEESYLPVLSVAAAVSPLLGLFGTVWGLVHAFIDISKKQSADIATVAPGIAEALITTLAGLIVAIPALIMFYYLKLQIASIEQSILIFSDRFISIVQNIFVAQIPEAPNVFKTPQASNMGYDNV
jgi:biopolymer transport protein TolQ